jgi:hypothetical protein
MEIENHIYKKKDIIARIVNNQMLLLSPDSMLLFRLNDLGTFIWNELDRNHLVGDLIDAISATYDVERDDLTTDIMDFLEKLKEKDLISKG